MNIYVGNLSRDVTEEELRQLFVPFGQVAAVSIIKDRYSGQSRGFAFIEMPVKSEGEAAIAGLKSKTLQDRTIDVSEARPRTDNRGGGSYGRGNGGSYGRGRGGTSGGGGRQQRRY
ncbi:MAG: RNA-binding protein [Chloroflexota bacterium]